MARFLFAYHGGNRPADGPGFMARWRAWMDGLGAAVVDPGIAVGPSKTVSASGVTDDGGTNPISGITVVEASDMGAALTMARACPHLDLGGSIEVAEAMNMKM